MVEHARGEPDVIVVRADRHVLGAKRGIAARQDADDVAGRVRRGCIHEAERPAHRVEVPRAGLRRLVGQDPVSQHGQRQAPLRDHRSLAQAQAELGDRDDVDVQVGAAQLGQAAAQVGAQQRLADQDDHRPQRVSVLGGEGVLDERRLDRRHRSGDDAMRRSGP